MTDFIAWLAINTKATPEQVVNFLMTFWVVIMLAPLLFSVIWSLSLLALVWKLSETANAASAYLYTIRKQAIAAAKRAIPPSVPPKP